MRVCRLNPELASVQANAGSERERRQQAEADALRAGVRLETLESMIARLRPGDLQGATVEAVPASPG